MTGTARWDNGVRNGKSQPAGAKLPRREGAVAFIRKFEVGDELYLKAELGGKEDF